MDLTSLKTIQLKRLVATANEELRRRRNANFRVVETAKNGRFLQFRLEHSDRFNLNDAVIPDEVSTLVDNEFVMEMRPGYARKRLANAGFKVS